jgi:hypothetical protein
LSLGVFIPAKTDKENPMTKRSQRTEIETRREGGTVRLTVRALIKANDTVRLKDGRVVKAGASIEQRPVIEAVKSVVRNGVELYPVLAAGGRWTLVSVPDSDHPADVDEGARIEATVIVPTQRRDDAKGVR